MKKLIVFLFLMLSGIIFAQPYGEHWTRVVAPGDTILPVITLENGFYLSAVKASDSTFSITTISFRVGTHPDSLAILEDDGIVVTYSITAGRWTVFDPLLFYTFKYVQPFFNEADDSYTTQWKLLSKNF